MKCFKVFYDDIEGRLDCFFYQPELVQLEHKVKRITDRKLGDYILGISGGATPNKNESEKYYSESGIPFLRVQNVTSAGLSLENCIFINQETHNNMLKRSQVEEGNLITKITGVGRMAVSAVAPPSFEGNINQHLVVIKTQSTEVSKVLATFLNSDIGERLAFRRSTGGTRPALNYEALKTIPVVYRPEIVEIMESAYERKKQKDEEAKKLLDSLNGFVLERLGISLPEINDKSCFVVWSDDIKGRKINPQAYTAKPKAIRSAIEGSTYPIKRLSDIVTQNISGEWGEDPVLVKKTDGHVLCRVLRNTNFVNQYNLNFENVAERLIRKDKYQKIRLKKGDILIEKSGGSPIQPVGRVALVESTSEGYAFSNFVQLIRISEECIPQYLFIFLKAVYALNYMEYLQNQTTGIKNLIMSEYLSIPIPIPPLEVQKVIADEVESRMQKAEQLQKEAEQEVEKAKAEVEKIILG